MPGLLNETELAILHDEWVEHRFVDPISVVSKAHLDIHSLLGHIEAQEEALGHARETARLLIRATEQLEQAQAAAAAIRQAAEVLRKLQRSHETERIWFFEGRAPVQQDEIIGKMCEAEDALDAALSGPAGQVPLDRIARLESLVSNSRRAVGMWRNLMGAGWDNEDCRQEAREATNDVADALAMLGLVSSEWKVLTEIDYLRADVQHLQDVAEAAEQLYQAFHKPSMVRWEDTVKLWMSCLHEALRQAGYLREKADAE